MDKNEYKKKQQEQCSHEWVGYKRCCYCGAFDGQGGQIFDLTEHPQYPVNKLANDFSEWYFGIKEQTGQPPLAMQIMFWFYQRMDLTKVVEFDHFKTPDFGGIEKLVLNPGTRNPWRDAKTHPPSSKIINTYFVKQKLKDSDEDWFPGSITYSGEWEISEDYEVIEWLDEELLALALSELERERKENERLRQLVETAFKEGYARRNSNHYSRDWEEFTGNNLKPPQ